jgi:hypothetical protein
LLTTIEAQKTTCSLCTARLAECTVDAGGFVLARLRFNVLVCVGIEGGHAMYLTTLGKIALCAADRISGGPEHSDAGDATR